MLRLCENQENNKKQIYFSESRLSRTKSVLRIKRGTIEIALLYQNRKTIQIARLIVIYRLTFPFEKKRETTKGRMVQKARIICAVGRSIVNLYRGNTTTALKQQLLF